MLIRTSIDLEKVFKYKSDNENYPIHFLTVNKNLISFNVVEENKDFYIDNLNNKFEAYGDNLIIESILIWDGLHICSVSGLKITE